MGVCTPMIYALLVKLQLFVLSKRKRSSELMRAEFFVPVASGLAVFLRLYQTPPLMSNASAVIISWFSKAFSTSCVNVAAASTADRPGTASKCEELIERETIHRSVVLITCAFDSYNTWLSKKFGPKICFERTETFFFFRLNVYMQPCGL